MKVIITRNELETNFEIYKDILETAFEDKEMAEELFDMMDFEDFDAFKTMMVENMSEAVHMEFDSNENLIIDMEEEMVNDLLKVYGSFLKKILPPVMKLIEAFSSFFEDAFEGFIEKWGEKLTPKSYLEEESNEED